MNKYCNSATIDKLIEVKTSAEQVMIETAPKLAECYANAKLLLPETTPYLPEIAKCTV